MPQDTPSPENRPVWEKLQRWAKGEIKLPVADLIGFRPVSYQPGEFVLEFDVDERHHNPNGSLHGGVLADVADAAMGCAYATTLGEDETHTTLELKINFLRPVWKGRVKFVGKVVMRGGRVGLAECDVLDEAGKLVARASSTLMILRAE